MKTSFFSGGQRTSPSKTAFFPLSSELCRQIQSVDKAISKTF